LRVALVTGMDSSAIARSICASLVKSGYEVVATSEGKYESGTEDREQFDADYADYSPVTFESVDFESEQSLMVLISRLSSRSYDLVVNGAATLATVPEGGLRNEATDFDYAEFSRVLQYNVTAVAAICIGLRNSIATKGVIINVTSSAGGEGAFATISYNASKAAVENLTKSLANTLGPSRGIRVNSIAPGWIPPSNDVAAGGVVALANALTPSLTTGDPEHVVAAVHYLIDNEFQNGSVLAVDGGITSSYLVYMLESLQLQGFSVDETLESLATMIAENKRKLSSSESV
jgi:NAD(P)-dependent dehydrogenase (short-subunit alcohol dehydrogenase family)